MALPKYVYTNNIPQATNKISSTQKGIQNNFQAINEFFNVNHVDLNDANAGKHKFLTLPFQGSLPTTTSSQMSLYSASTSDGNGSEIFFTYPTAVTGTPLTGLGGSSLPAATGYAYLGGSVLMKWGTATGITTGTNNIIFPVSASIPVFSSITTVQFTPASTYTLHSPALFVQGPYITNVTTTGFTLNSPNAISSSVYWYAIGL